MIAYGKTDVGRTRVSNQDAFCIENLDDGSVLAVVCDGMGGANAGNIASEKAVSSIRDFFMKSRRTDSNANDIAKLLKNAIVSANIEIYDMSLKSRDLSGMGTTVVAAFAGEKFTVIAHVGDSRAYLITDKAEQLTRDHSVVQSLIESGTLTPEEARVHPRKNVITRALGTEENVLVDVDVYPQINNDEKLLLCSDGLTNYVENSEILEIFNKNAIDRVASVMVARANYNGGGDNITAIAVSTEQKG